MKKAFAVLSITVLVLQLVLASSIFWFLNGAGFVYAEGSEELGPGPSVVWEDWEPVTVTLPKDPPVHALTEFDYMLFDDHGGWWCDAEKTTDVWDDTYMCWAAAASNALEWTGWGIVPPLMDTTDEMLRQFVHYWYDRTGYMLWGWEWWFDGSTHTKYDGENRIEHDGGGNYYPLVNLYDYYREEADDTKVMAKIDSFLHSGYAVTLIIKQNDGFCSHAVTCWGYRYTLLGVYTGIWITDSDDNMDFDSHDPPPDTLRFYDLAYNDVLGRWEMPDYSGGWHLDGVMALAPKTGNRPIAYAGGPYFSENGYVDFDGGQSVDGDGDALQFRWDFNADGIWETGYSGESTISVQWAEGYVGAVLLEVFDGVFKDVVKFTVNQPARSVNAGLDQTVVEGCEVSFEGSYSDLEAGSPYIVMWNFGDGTDAVYGTLTPTHIYKDEGDYRVTFTVIEKDRTQVSDQLTVEVVSVEGALLDLNDYIQGLDDGCFKNKAVSSKRAIGNFLSAVNKMILEEAYTGAINSLVNNLRAKADGLVDGKTGNDWVIDVSAQQEICRMIDDIVEHLRALF